VFLVIPTKVSGVHLIKFLLKVGVEESIVNAPLVSHNAKSEVRFKQQIRDLQSVVRSQSTLQRQL
jgi:hypothetical protein